MNTENTDKTLGQIGYEAYFTRGELVMYPWGKHADVCQGFENAAAAVRAAVLAGLPDFYLLPKGSILKEGDQLSQHGMEFAGIVPTLVGEKMPRHCHGIRRLRPAALVVEPPVPASAFAPFAGGDMSGSPKGLRPPVQESLPQGTDVPPFTEIPNNRCPECGCFVPVTGHFCTGRPANDKAAWSRAFPAPTPPAEWKLPPLPEGLKYHREDWTKDMLPEGFRPALLGEVETEWHWMESRIAPDLDWVNATWGEPEEKGEFRGVPSHIFHHRTRRPLPVEPPASQVPVEEKRLPDSSWVSCPICGGTDMHKVRDGEEDDFLITCTNCSCRSNGGDMDLVFDAIDRLSTRCGFPVVLDRLQVLNTIGNRVEKQDRMLTELQTHIAEEKEKGIAARDRAFASEQENERLRALYAWVPTLERKPTRGDADDEGAVWVLDADGRALFCHWTSVEEESWLYWMRPIPRPLPTAPVVEDDMDQFNKFWASEERPKEAGPAVLRAQAYAAFLAGQNSAKPTAP